MPRLVFIQFHIPVAAVNGANAAAAESSNNADASTSTNATNASTATPGTPGSTQNISPEEFLRLFTGFVPIHITPLSEHDIPEQLLRDIAAGVFGHHGPPKPPAMDKQAREELPRFVYDEQRTAFLKKHDEGCTVCLSEFERGENVTHLPCGHLFHSECVDKWIEEHNTCPTCRYEMKVTDKELEKKRVEQMEQRYGKAQFHILEESSQIERLFNCVYDMKIGSKAATSQEAKVIDFKLEKIIDHLDAMSDLDEDTHAKRREQIVKVQQTQQMLLDVTEKCREEEHLDHILNSTLEEILRQQKDIQRDLSKSPQNTVPLQVEAPQKVKNTRRGTSSSQKFRSAPQITTQTAEESSFLSAKSDHPATPLTPADLNLLFDDHNSMDSFDVHDPDTDKKRQNGENTDEATQRPRKKRRIEDNEMQDIEEQF